MKIKELKSSRSLVSIKRDRIDNLKIQGFVLAYSDSLVLIQYVYDFILDGLMVLRLADISEMSSTKTDIFQNELLKHEGLYDKIDFDADYDVSSWPTVFKTLGEKFKYVIVEDEREEDPVFLLGLFEKIDQNSVYLTCFSGAANWDSEFAAMDFKDISSFQVNNNYINVYKRHFERIE